MLGEAHNGCRNSLGPLRADVIYIERIHAGARANEEPVLLRSSEGQVGGGFRQVNLAYEIPVGRQAAHSIFAWVAPTVAAPDIAAHIGAYTVGYSWPKLCKDPAIAQPAVIHVEDSHVGGSPDRQAAVDDVETRLIRGKGQTVGPHEIPRNHRCRPSMGI